MIIKQEIVKQRQEPTQTIVKVAGVPMTLTVRDAWEGGSTADEQGYYARQTWLEPVTPIKYWQKASQP